MNILGDNFGRKVGGHGPGGPTGSYAYEGQSRKGAVRRDCAETRWQEKKHFGQAVGAKRDATRMCQFRLHHFVGGK